MMKRMYDECPVCGEKTMNNFYHEQKQERELMNSFAETLHAFLNSNLDQEAHAKLDDCISELLDNDTAIEYGLVEEAMNWRKLFQNAYREFYKPFLEREADRLDAFIERVETAFDEQFNQKWSCIEESIDDAMQPNE